MIKESYNCFDFNDKTEFFFASEGSQGRILKGIAFTYIENNLWNLAFGDVNHGDIDDSVISNNHDIVKLISTIAKVVYDFSNEYPLRHILIQPVDEKRKKLYNHVFRRNYSDINLVFHITGLIEDNEEDYLPEKFYDKFKLKRKFVK